MSSGSTIDDTPKCRIYRALSARHLVTGTVFGVYSVVCVVLMTTVFVRPASEVVEFHWPWRMYLLWPVGAVLLPWALYETAAYLYRRTRQPAMRRRTWWIATTWFALAFPVVWMARDAIARYVDSDSGWVRTVVVQYPYRHQTAQVVSLYLQADKTNWQFGADRQHVYAYFLSPEIPELCFAYRGARKSAPDEFDSLVRDWPAASPPRSVCIRTYGQLWRPFVEFASVAALLALIIFVAVPIVERTADHRRRVAVAGCVVVLVLLLLLPFLFGYRFAYSTGQRLLCGVLYDFAVTIVCQPHLYWSVSDILVPVLAGLLGWSAFLDRFLLYVAEARKPIGIWELDGD